MTRGITQDLLRSLSGSTSLFERLECSKEAVLAIGFNEGLEAGAPRILSNAGSTQLIATRYVAVHCVAALRRFTQIAQSVVDWIAIFMVDKSGPPSVRQGESYAVGEQKLSPKVPYQITRVVQCGECPCPGVPGVPLFAACFRADIPRRSKIRSMPTLPSQKTSRGIIIHPLTQIFDVWQRPRSHIASPISVVVRAGQRWRAAPARYFPSIIMKCSQLFGDLRRSTLLRKHLEGDYAGAAKEFARWKFANGRVLKGLVRRRAAEAKLYRS